MTTRPSSAPGAPRRGSDPPTVNSSAAVVLTVTRTVHCLHQLYGV